MSPRVIQIPLSGGDRKHYARELRRVEHLHENLVRDIPPAFERADAQLREAHRLVCEEWNARQFIGGDAAPSPVIADAIHARCTQLEASCKACGRTRLVDLTEVVWPREKLVHTLAKVLFCVPCHTDSGRKLRPNLVALRMAQTSDSNPPSAARSGTRCR